jgi:hypothetical protein
MIVSGLASLLDFEIAFPEKTDHADPRLVSADLVRVK